MLVEEKIDKNKLYHDTVEMLDKFYFKEHNPKVFVSYEYLNNRMNVIFVDADTKEYLGVYAIEEEIYNMIQKHYGLINLEFSVFSELIDKFRSEGILKGR